MHHFKRCSIKKFMFDASKLPRDVSQSTTEATWLLTTIFETTSAAAASKVETCSRWNVAFHMYPALQLMQTKVLPMSFEDENFVGDQLTIKTAKITSLKKLYIAR